jgi:hypothetical protein
MWPVTLVRAPSVTEIGIAQDRFVQVGPAQVGPKQARPGEVCFVQVRVGQVGPEELMSLRSASTRCAPARLAWLRSGQTWGLVHQFSPNSQAKRESTRSSRQSWNVMGARSASLQ